MSLQLRQLRYSIKIVEAGGFSCAAGLVDVAQPALSQQLAELEAELGLTLPAVAEAVRVPVLAVVRDRLAAAPGSVAQIR